MIWRNAGARGNSGKNSGKLGMYILDDIKDMSTSYNIDYDTLYSVIVLVLNKIAQKYYDSSNVFCVLSDQGVKVNFYRNSIKGVFGDALSFVDLINFISTLNLNEKLLLPDLSDNVVESQLPFESTDDSSVVLMKVLDIIKRFHVLQKEYDVFKHSEGKLISGYILKIVSKGRSDNSVLLYVNITTQGLESVVICKSFNHGFSIGDKIYVYIREVVRSNQGKQIIADINSEEFLFHLLREYIPNLCDENIQEDSMVQVVVIARVPGKKSLVVVKALNDISNPLSICIGVNGERIKKVNDGLGKERLQILEYNEDNVQLIKSMFRAVEVDVKYHEFETPCYYLVVDQNDVGIVVGAKGANVVLLKKLLDCEVAVMVESKYLEAKSANEKQAQDKLISLLNISVLNSQLLIAHGIYTIHGIDEESLEKVDGISEQDKKAMLAKREEVNVYCEKLMLQLDIAYDVALILVSNDMEKIDDITLKGLKSITVIKENDDLRKELYKRILAFYAKDKKDIEDGKDVDDVDD